MTETARTEDRGGWKRANLDAGAVHGSALPRRCCRFASGSWDLTVVTFSISGAGTVKRVATLTARARIATRTTAVRHLNAKL